MFLSNLDENTKQSFLNLALCVAKSDNNFSTGEQEMLEAFSREMAIPCQPQEETIEKILTDLSSCSDVEKKIVVFELVGLVWVDNLVASEKEILDKCLSKFNLTNDFLSKCHEQVLSVMDNFKNSTKLIFG